MEAIVCEDGNTLPTSHTHTYIVRREDKTYCAGLYAHVESKSRKPVIERLERLMAKANQRGELADSRGYAVLVIGREVSMLVYDGSKGLSGLGFDDKGKVQRM